MLLTDGREVAFVALVRRVGGAVVAGYRFRGVESESRWWHGTSRKAPIPGPYDGVGHIYYRRALDAICHSTYSLLLYAV